MSQPSPPKYKKDSQGQYVCPYCNITKKNMNTMYYHIKKHDPTLPFACKYCDLKFVCSQYLDLHYLSKHKLEQHIDNRHTCPYPGCDFHNSLETNVRTHFMRIHCKDIVKPVKVTTEENNTQCNICSRTFSSQPAFYYHVFDCVKPIDTHPAYSAYHSFIPENTSHEIENSEESNTENV